MRAAKVLAPGVVLTLDGTASRAGLPGHALAYQWEQTEGPPLVLSNPFAAVTTFVTPDLGSSSPQEYAFELLAIGDGVSSPAAAVSFETGAPGSASVMLFHGLNLVTPPVDPSGADAYDLTSFLEALGAPLAAWPRTASGSDYEVWFASEGHPAPAVDGSQAYVIPNEGPGRNVTLTGPSWAEGHLGRSLRAGSNLVAFPRGVPDGVNASTLSVLAGSGYVVRVQDPDGTYSRAQIYLPGLTVPFALEPGRGYLVHSTTARPVQLPSRY